MADEFEFMTFEDWSARFRPEKSTDEWKSIVVRKVGGIVRKGDKRNYWIGWNGHRFSRNADCSKLATHHPDLMERMQRHLVAS